MQLAKLKSYYILALFITIFSCTTSEITSHSELIPILTLENNVHEINKMYPLSPLNATSEFDYFSNGLGNVCINDDQDCVNIIWLMKFDTVNRLAKSKFIFGCVGFSYDNQEFSEITDSLVERNIICRDIVSASLGVEEHYDKSKGIHERLTVNPTSLDCIVYEVWKQK